MNRIVIGHNPIYSLESDPFIVKNDDIFHLYNWDLFGIKEHISHDGIHFKFKKYLVFNALRPFIEKNILFFEKIISYKNFPFYKSEIRSLDLNTNDNKVVANKDNNSCCPSIVDGLLFYSTNFKKMDHGTCEPTRLKILNGPKIIGLKNISSLRKFGDKYLGTLIQVKNGKSFAKIVNCIPIKFPNLWKIGQDFLTATDIATDATHVYIASIIDQNIYVNVRFGRKIFSSERIIVKQI